MTPLILSEANHLPPATPSERDNQAMTEAARLSGFRIYHIPTNFDECEDAEGALWHVPVQEEESPAIWIGFIPAAERYAAIYEAAKRRNIRLVNSVEEHLLALEFDRAYPYLKDLTPETVILDDSNNWQEAERQLSYPVFIKGASRSLKNEGWNACVATNREELRDLIGALFASPYRSRGRVLVRRLASLRHVRVSDEGFPLGREYRVFVLSDEVVGMGYYWDGEDDLAELRVEESAAVSHLALLAAARVGVPFVAADVGQTVEGDWIIIEIGDAQFAGHGQIPLTALWQNMYRRMQTEPPLRKSIL